MINTYNTSVNGERVEAVITDLPSMKEQEVVRAIFDKFRTTADRRNRAYQNFDGDTLIDYISDSVDRYITNVFERDGIEDWQARAFNPFTRNKVTTILGKVVQVLPIASLKSIGEDDPLKGRVLTDIYHYSEEIDDYDEFMINFLQEAIVKGTAIAYEGQVTESRKLRTVSGGKENVTHEKKSRLFSKLVRLEDFYPSSVGIRNIKEMPYCFWRDVITYEEFLGQYGEYDNLDRVKGERTELESERRPFYLDYISADVGEGNVEIIRYYSKTEDEFVILANGVWLNPVGKKNGAEFVSPLTFEHKELPFWDIKFESFGDNFFYGKSLPDKLKSLQDVLNVLMNMLLDQSFLTIFPPLITNGYDDIEDDYLRPGRRTPIDTQGMPVKDAFVKLDMGTPSAWHQFILSYTENVMEQASIDKVSSGQAGAGDRTTAQEIRTAAEGVESTLGLFARLVRSGVKRKALLRTGLIMQYWTKKESPVLYKSMMKHEGEAFNVFKVTDGIMTGGKRGRKIVEMFGDETERPTKDELIARKEIFEAESGQRIEITAIPAKYIREVQLEVELIANPKSQFTQDSEKALVLEKARVYMSFFPDLVDKEELLTEIAEAYGDDPTKVIKQQEQQPDMEGNPEADKGANTNPEMNTANNLARSAAGGERSSAALNAISANITG